MTNETDSKTGHTAHGEAQRRALVLAAKYIIAEDGFERLRTRDVAARAGVNIATLHYYFATKEDLIRAVVDRLQREFEEIHDPEAPVAIGARAAIRREYTDEMYHLRQDPSTYAALLEIATRSLHDPFIRRMMRQIDADWRRYLETLLVEGNASAALRPGIDIPSAAALLIVFFKGFIIQMLTLPDTFSPDATFAAFERSLFKEDSPE
jgi:AcrR family transcriptional regulator